MGLILHRNSELKAKFDASDIVQDVSVLAATRFSDFRGETEAEFTAWLRTTMARVSADAYRHFTRKRRDVQLEEEFKQDFDNSSVMLAESAIVASEPSPSEQAMHRERAVLIAEVLDALPEHYREIIVLRDFEGKTLQEVGDKTGRSADSVRKMWVRAIVMVRDGLEDKL